MQTLLKIITFTAGIIFSYTAFATPSEFTTPNCHPAVNEKLPQYIMGYGSLIQTQSKNKTYPESGPSIPVLVDGFRRGWFAEGLPIGYSTIFLSVIKNNKSKLNGVVFNLPESSAISKFDKREIGYCRAEISPSEIHLFNQHAVPQGQFWIYYSPSDTVRAPSKKFPIVESYVDIFLSGCLEIQKTFGLEKFAEECIDTTYNWSPYWINDRVYPRRPFQDQPDALKIDELLAKKLPEDFSKIKIE